MFWQIRSKARIMSDDLQRNEQHSLIREQKLWKLSALEKYFKIGRQEVFSSIISGFEMACMNGPLMGEEMLGACFVIDEVEVCDKKAVEFLCSLA